MKRRSLIVSLALAASLAGCWRTRVVYDVAGPNRSSARWHHSLLLGIIDVSGTIHLDRACPEGLAALEVETSFLNAALTGLTLGVYTPQTAAVRCAGALPER